MQCYRFMQFCCSVAAFSFLPPVIFSSLLLQIGDHENNHVVCVDVTFILSHMTGHARIFFLIWSCSVCLWRLFVNCFLVQTVMFRSFAAWNDCTVLADTAAHCLTFYVFLSLDWRIPWGGRAWSIKIKVISLYTNRIYLTVPSFDLINQ